MGKTERNGTIVITNTVFDMSKVNDDQSILEMMLEKIRSDYTTEIEEFARIKHNNTERVKSSFNLISELHIDNKQMYENAHTRVLSAILTYDKTNAFLLSFLKRCGLKDKRIMITNKTKIEIEPELQYTKKNNTWGRDAKRSDDDRNHCRPDCVIWKKNQFAVVIENKINGAPETPNQVVNYIEAVSTDPAIKLTNKENIWVVYLGGDSEDLPSEKSISSDTSLASSKISLFLRGKGNNRRAGKHLSLISYKNTIIPWLEEDVLPICPYGETSLTGGLLVYIDYLKQKFDCYLSENERITVSDAVRDIFIKLEKKDNTPFIERYQKAREYVSYSDESDEKTEFFNALRLFYLNHHFRFKDSSFNRTWVISCRGHRVFVWKKTWTSLHAKAKTTGILYFELYSYQIDKFLVNPNYKQTITCSLKGIDEQLNTYLKINGVNIDDYIFAKEKKDALQLNREKGFFDSFIADKTIQEKCEEIDKLLKKYKKENSASQ